MLLHFSQMKLFVVVVATVAKSITDAKNHPLILSFLYLNIQKFLNFTTNNSQELNQVDQVPGKG